MTKGPWRSAAQHSGTRILVLKTDSYGPSIGLRCIWSLSANSHFGPQSLAQTLLASPPFIRLACCLRAGDPNEHSFHGYSLLESQHAIDRRAANL